MPNYQNSKIYKLVNTNTKQTYIGSTTRDLKQRLREHKSLYTSGKTKKEKSYLLFNENDKVIIELLENVNCNNKKELHDREKYYIKNYECVNINQPTRTSQEYYKDTKQSLKNYHKNREEINKKRNEKIECECGSVISRSVLCKHKKTKKHINFITNIL